LRNQPDTQRFEEELLQVKMREAEAQLAIKDLQKTIHVLNLEYQEFLNNRTAATVSLSSNSTNETTNNNTTILEEELLKVKMREAEVQSELKSINLKSMQLDTEVNTHISSSSSFLVSFFKFKNDF
jgi:ecotropic viral integration site 5 protein